jgi:aminoglycoside phosphotransferase (APT) family kinase protein
MIGAKLGAGREADVYAWGDDAVVKLYRPGFLGHRAEAVALAGLDGRGIAPRLVDTVQCDGRTGLVLERLGGADMLSLLRRQPWRALRLARALADTHVAVHEVRAPGDLPELRQALAARIAGAVMPPRLRDYALRMLDALPTGDRLCHGDYHPGNVLVAADPPGTDRVAVIDWPNAVRGVPEADHARTLLLLRRADPLPDTPATSRALIAAGRSVFARRYARAYRDGSSRPPRQTAAWLVVHAAARLSEGIEAERATLVGLLNRARRRAGR